ncbi:acetate--CoA ligase family protein [Nocardia gipuzkoensis]|uniref:acetate--CoA ligase family protein n=1 Tax=Nocardia gipuzkoensis TaxID=2749991 RepID=UPI0015EEADD5|nr:acetate--CoA ligase family protein [Nocardia gipuzkoensis]
MTAITTAPTTPRTGLERLLRPHSVAVVGASSSPGKLGTVMLDAIGRVPDGPTAYGINPKADAASTALHPSIREATRVHGAPLDLAVLCVPADATPTALQDAADAGVGGALICSGGFAEAGAEGTALQQRIAEISAATGIRVLGPNTSGFFRPGSAIVSFVPTVEHIRPGTVGLVAASGGMNHALSFLLSERGVGIGLGVGLGNCVDITAVDVLEYLRADPSVTAIALHVETVDDGERLLAAVRAASADKPVVAIVVGRSDVSAFSESHTGALATSWRTTRALLAEAGAVVVDSEQQLVDALAVLSRIRLAASVDPGIGLVTAQAGPGLMVLDELQAKGVRVPTLASETQQQIAQLLPPMTYQANPVDTGRPGPTFPAVLTATAADPQIDALAVYALAEPDAIDLADAVRRADVHPGTPVALGIGGPAAAVTATGEAAALLGIPVLPSPTALATGVHALVQDSRLRHANSAADRRAPMQLALPALPADEAAAKDLLDALGIATPDRRVCTDRAAAHGALSELTAPVAVKILDATVLHKTEVGGVHLNVRTTADLDAALDALDAISAPGYLLESMAEPGVDLIVGAHRDPVFGPILVAGLGGTAAEAIGDVAIRSSHLTLAGAATMLDDLQFAPLLDGWRGGPTLDREDFAHLAVAIVSYLAAHPSLSDIEINPLRLTSTGLVALDAVVVAAGSEGELS